jgi:N-acetylglucosaminyl-diphospho-decaprenol L-rhamnosyltransferase
VSGGAGKVHADGDDKWPHRACCASLIVHTLQKAGAGQRREVVADKARDEEALKFEPKPNMSTIETRAKPITVSIVSHGHIALVRALLGQLDAYSHAVIEKVVLTVNVPETDELAGLSWRFPVERIDNASAQGFGANHNRAFLRCATPWFLVLNPDIRLEGDVLSPLVECARQSSGLLTPRIFEPGQTQPEQHRRMITPLEIFTRRRPLYPRPAIPDWIPGLFMLFRSTAFAQISGFDERFFMYGEDFDICARTQLAGWQVQVGENLLAIHDARRASHNSIRHFYWHAISLLKVWGSKTFWQFKQMRCYERQRNNHPRQPE